MTATTIRNIIIAIVCLLVAVGAFTFMVLEVRQKEKVLQEQLSALNEELLRESSFYKLQKTAADSESDRELLATYFLQQESDSIDVLNWIEEMAPKAGVTLQTKGLQKVTDKETKADWIEINFSFSGERADVQRFLAILERLPYLSYVTNMSLTARASNNWEAVVTLRAYIFKYDK